MIERLIWVVPLVVAVLGAWRPRAGLVALVAALPLFGSPPGGPYLAAMDVAGLAAILTAWRGGRPRSSALTWPAAALVAVSLLSLAPSPYSPPSWRPSVLLDLLAALPGVEGWPALYTWRAAADLLLGWGLFLAARRAFAGRSPLPLAWGLLGGLAGTLLVGLVAHAGVVSLDAYRPVLFGRLASFFFLSGWLSQYLVVAAPVAIAALYLAGPRWRLLSPLLVAMILISLALTLQRGAWLAVLAQFCFWATQSLRRGRLDRAATRRLAAAAALTLVMAGIVLVGLDAPLDLLADRLRSIPSGLETRLPLWDAAIEMFCLRPILGWGLGSFTPAYDLLHPPGSEGAMSNRATAHSLYLQVAAERGVPGLLALGLLVLTIVACLRRPSRGQEALTLALAISLVGAAVYGLVQTMYFLRSLAWLLWLLIACVSLVSRHEGPTRTSRISQALVVAVLLLLPFRALLVDAPPYAGNREFGFHRTEGHPSVPFQWTEGTAARWLEPAGDTLILTLANGHPLAGSRPVAVVVGIDGETVARLTISGGWEEHRFDLGPRRRDRVLLTLRARPTFRPFSDYLGESKLSRSVDIRSLGVAVRDIGWE